MNIFLMKATYPIDSETYQEVLQLLQNAEQQDGQNYKIVMHESEWRNPQAHGFLALAYDDDKDELIGVASAIDVMGLNTFEWSTVVAPMYRRMGIGEHLVQGITSGFEERGAAGELALTLNGEEGRNFIEKQGYEYSFSEATLRVDAEVTAVNNDLTIRLYNDERDALVTIFESAFNDMPEETDDLIAFNTSKAGRVLWVAEKDGVIVGTVTSVLEGDVQWVTALAVHPGFQRQGIGTALLAWLKAHAVKEGQSTVMLDVEIENEQALSVYERAGFSKIQQVDFFAKK
ncbi:GNAT family N-acetyltransferase [Viridibacillus sp. YIM B01967]|uniref:GNAT family N-acetyltransferase n=1 Tax=Viridibacillus soli TaxID=2798301 RepID=A0ABS1H905_9BACL|nr:GNAT family N-acetyltransferase [Viridibacillus soli]MBK3495498.1 GNAT family N-acetyltransferase [Viridibacillus soli]